jgi:hypothetical protein
MRKFFVAVLVVVSLALAVGVYEAVRAGLVEKTIHARWLPAVIGVVLVLAGFCFWWFSRSPSQPRNRGMLLSLAMGNVIFGSICLAVGLYPVGSWVLVALILIGFFVFQGLLLVAALRGRASRVK